VVGTKFKLKLTFPKYIAGEAVIEGELLDQNGGTVLQARMRPSTWTLVKALTFMFLGVALLTVGLLRGDFPMAIIGAPVCLLMVAIEVVGYSRNKRHAAPLLDHATQAEATV